MKTARSRQSPPLRLPARLSADRVAFLRLLNDEERGRLLVAACRAAAALERGRAESGLPPSLPAPWPPSTAAFFKRHAPNGRRRRRAAAD